MYIWRCISSCVLLHTFSHDRLFLLISSTSVPYHGCSELLFIRTLRQRACLSRQLWFKQKNTHASRGMSTYIPVGAHVCPRGLTNTNHNTETCTHLHAHVRTLSNTLAMHVYDCTNIFGCILTSKHVSNAAYALCSSYTHKQYALVHAFRHTNVYSRNTLLRL